MWVLCYICESNRYSVQRGMLHSTSTAIFWLCIIDFLCHVQATLHPFLLVIITWCLEKIKLRIVHLWVLCTFLYHSSHRDPILEQINWLSTFTILVYISLKGKYMSVWLLIFHHVGAMSVNSLHYLSSNSFPDSIIGNVRVVKLIKSILLLRIEVLSHVIWSNRQLAKYGGF